jgi:hypothetical protein
MKSKFTTVEFPVFSDFIVHIEITSDIVKSIKKYPGVADLAEEADNEADAVTVYDNGQICFIFLHHNVTVGTIAHEAFHVIEHMMKRFGVDLEGEAVAYHLGYLVDKIFRFIRGKRV